RRMFWKPPRRCLRWLGPGLFLIATGIPLWLMARHGESWGGPRQGWVELMWGEHGVLGGYLFRPRALTIDPEDRLYIADKTGRIQVFTADGEFLRQWRTPASDNGMPTGLSFSRSGLLIVPDTHYYQVLFYTPSGKLLADRTLGGEPG